MRWLLCWSCCIVATSSVSAQAQDATVPAPAENVQRATNQQLIEQLASTSDFGIGFHPTAWVSGFIAVDEEPQFQGGIIGSRKPSVNPAMKELVRRGIAALPDLIAHLSDERPTPIKISSGLAGVTWHSDEYDSRPPAGKPKAVGLNTGKGDLLSKPYTLRVGDLCYVTIGQIVNRRFHAVRYQPSGCFVINSPVENSALATAVKDQWSGLTAEEHRKSLFADCLDTRPYADWAAWQRLRFYYPELAEETALKLLARPIYDNSKLWSFISKVLVKETDESQWQPLIDQYVQANGPASKEMLPFWMHWIYWDTHIERTQEFLADRAMALNILAKLYPDFDRQKPAFLNAADVDQHATAITALASYPSHKLDLAIFNLFRAATQFNLVEEEQYKVIGLVDVSLKRLGGVGFQMNGDPETLLVEIKRLLADTEPSKQYFHDTRYVALRAALRFFPKQAKDLFENFRSANDEWTREAKMYVLSEPTDPQPWMIEFLAAFLDNTTKTEEVYGPEWDWQSVRVCDQAARILANDYLHVDFVFEQNPAYLTQQIVKIRRVLAGEKGIRFDPPPKLLMPKELPTRAATRIVELKAEFGDPYAFSTELQLWVGSGFEGRGGCAYDTLRLDAEQNKTMERTPLDQWNGGVSLLDNGLPQFAYCYHGYEGGQLFVRDLRTGRIIKTVKTPFHAGIEFDDPLQVRNLGDVTLCGKDARWLIALTEDLKLHSVDVETGKHRVEWEFRREEKGSLSHANILGFQGSSLVLLQDVGMTFSDPPLRIWDQSTRAMRVIEKAPRCGWVTGWGKMAWNSKHPEAPVWNLAAVQEIPIALGHGSIECIACGSDQRTMFVLRDGAVDVFRIVDSNEAQPIHRLLSPVLQGLRSASLVVSTSEQWLFVRGWRQTKEELPNETCLVIFDISDLTK